MPVAVLGAGAYGTALANAAAAAGHSVVLYGRDAAAMDALGRTRENARYLPGVRLHERIAVTAMLAACADAAVVLAAVPTHALRALLREAGPVLRPDSTLVLCAKGIERGTQCFPSGIAWTECPALTVAALSGPSFADDVARGLPTAVTLACGDAALARDLCDRLASPFFRPYASTDVRGVEIGGAAKNVLAIACGIAEGRGLGASARAALTARGFAELLRFGTALGARPETLMGLSGLGDLLLTCSSAQSRNFALGVAIGRGTYRDGGPLAEGAWTAPALAAMAGRLGVAMPIADAVDAVLAGRTAVDAAIDGLMTRPLREE